MPPAVSVILPTYNRASLLREAVDSVRSQTWEDWELLVIDDGSTDGTREVGRTGDPRIRWFRQDRGGPSRARNRGMQEARGEFIAFLDSDDLWMPEKLQLQLQVFRKEPRVGAVCCDMLESDGKGDRPATFFQRIGFTGELTAEKMFFHNPVAIQTLVARQSAIERVGGFDTDLWGSEDYEFAYRLLRAAPVRSLFRSLVSRRLQPDRLSRDRRRMAEGTLRTLERALEWFPELRESLGPALGRRFARLHVDLAYAHFLEEDFPRGRATLLRSLRLAPGTGRAWLYLLASLLGRHAFRRIREFRRSAIGGDQTETAAHPGS